MRGSSQAAYRSAPILKTLPQTVSCQVVWEYKPTQQGTLRRVCSTRSIVDTSHIVMYWQVIANDESSIRLSLRQFVLYRRRAFWCAWLHRANFGPNNSQSYVIPSQTPALNIGGSKRFEWVFLRLCYSGSFE